jgi:hypothetical protein
MQETARTCDAIMLAAQLAQLVVNLVVTPVVKLVVKLSGISCSLLRLASLKNMGLGLWFYFESASESVRHCRVLCRLSSVVL